MNITDSVYSNVYMVSFNLDDLCDRGISVDKICITGGNQVILNTTREILVAMRDKINELFPPEPDEHELDLPEEPEEPGYYITQQNLLVIKDSETDWHMTTRHSLWKDGSSFTNDWGIVYKTLGDEAFPLTKLNITKEH